MNLSLGSNVSHTFAVFHCAWAAQSNVLDAELRLPASQRAGQMLKNQRAHAVFVLCSGDTGF